MITREQVADLREGDVVEIGGHPMQYGSTTRGPLRQCGSALFVGDRLVRYGDGSVNQTYADRMSLTVVSRAPRPLYTNSDRTEPVPGDVAVCADGTEPPGNTYHFLGDEDSAHWWRFDDSMKDSQPKVMRLLVDGETGRCVQ